MPVESICIDNVYYANNPGNVTFDSNGICWKSPEGINQSLNSDLAVAKNDILRADYLNCAGRFNLRVYVRGPSETLKCFSNISLNNIGKIQKLFEEWEFPLKHIKMNIKGENEGRLDLNSHSLDFISGSQPICHLYFGQMDQCRAVKNDLSIEFLNENISFDCESLSEIRFSLPPPLSGELADSIREKAGLEFSAKNTIVQFKNILLLTPRGRYEIALSRNMLYLRGKTFSFKADLAEFANMFLLPNMSEGHFLVIRLKKPMVQGKTLYPFIVVSFPLNSETSADIDVPPEELREKYRSKLTPKMEGPTFKILSRVLKTLSNTKVFMPGSFESFAGQKSLRCALRTSSGLLYPLEGSFVFCYKPCVYIQHSEIDSIEFLRLLDNITSTKLFDLAVKMKRGKRDIYSRRKEQTYLFTGIEKSEFAALFSFIKRKTLRIVNREILEKTIMRNSNSGARRNSGALNLNLPGSDESSSSGSDFEAVSDKKSEVVSENSGDEVMEDDCDVEDI